MKKNKQWEKSELDLQDFLWQSPCEIDEDLYNYIAEVTPPSFCINWIVQSWEMTNSKNWICYYDTVTSINDKYFYLWILPKFEE